MTISRNLVPGDRIVDKFYSEGSEGRNGIVLSHPTDNSKILVVFGDHAVVTKVDMPLYDYDNDWTIVDETREAWDALARELRATINWMATSENCIANNGLNGLGRKIQAIKLLRAVTGLGLAESKRAVEEFYE